jgi:bacteriorhodopsin
MNEDAEPRRRKTIGGIMLVCTLAAIAVTWTVEGKWVFVGCAAFLVVVAITVPLMIPRAKD